MSVSRETERLSAFAALVKKWNGRINLVSPSTIDHLRQRHFEDCLQLARIAQPRTGLWADLGSGGGFPGIVMAIAAAHTETEFVLVESDLRKATFLRTAIRELDLNARVEAQRIESLEPLNADAISARALAPMSRLVPYLRRHLAPSGRAWLMKGQKWKAEIAAVRGQGFTFAVHESETEPDAAILELTDLQP